MQTSTISQHFSTTYAQARQQFFEAVRHAKLEVESHVLAAHRGAEDEVLATDVVLRGAPNAAKLLIISSGIRGPEGFCSSGAQVGLLHDSELLDRLMKADVALLLIHEVNPYGFSHLQRTNEDNIDLNRNCLNFAELLPGNAGNAEIEPLLLPQTWPPTPDNAVATEAYIRKHDIPTYREAMSSGHSVGPDGMFYAGVEPSWSS